MNGKTVALLLAVVGFASGASAAWICHGTFTVSGATEIRIGSSVFSPVESKERS